MATVSQSELLAAAVKARQQGSPYQVKMSDGKTRTVYHDGSWSGDPIPAMADPTGNSDIRSLVDTAMPAPTPAPAPQQQATPIAQVAPKASTPAPVTPPPVQPTTPVAQVAPQPAAVPFALQGGNASLFSNIDPKTGLPIVNQKTIDAELKKTGLNFLTSNNSNIRDAIYGSGWNAKSDAVQVANGAAIYGLTQVPAGMGGKAYAKLNGGTASDQDFINAAKEAGIDISGAQFQRSQNGGMGSIGAKVLDQDAVYNALQAKGKDLYSITNVINSTGARGAAEPHATILFTSDGNGNLVAAANPTTGQPAVKYESATRYASDPGFLSDWGPLLGMAGLAFGIPALSEFMGPGVIGSGLEAGTAAGATGMVSAGALPGVVGGMGALAPEIAAYSGAPLTAALDYGQVASDTAAAAGGYSDVVPASELGSQNTAFGPYQGANIMSPDFPMSAVVPGGTAPAIPPLTGTQQLMQALGIGGNNQSALGNLINPGGSNTGAISTALGNSALTGLLGSGGQALASYFGGQAQADAAKQAAANQMSMFNTINNQLAPQRGAGYQSLNQIRSMLPGQYMAYSEAGTPTGIQTGTDYLTRQFNPQDLQAGLAPNYNFMLNQGQQAQQRAANVGGGLIGGNALRGLEDYTQNYAQNAYQQAFNNFNTQRTGIYNTLAGIAGIGQNATNTTAQAGQNATTAAGQLGVGAAAANAAGLTGAANAIQGGVQNYQGNQIAQQAIGQNQNYLNQLAVLLGQNQNVAQTATPPYAP